jgi:hypothetical protein
MDHVYRQFLNHAAGILDRMGPQGWVLVLAAMIVVGGVCMRGFGSRSRY